MRTLCAVEKCDSPVDARGWCAKHYRRWLAHGDPLALMASPWGSTGWERLSRFVERGAPDECWEFTGCVKGGYGVVMMRGRQQQAHRLAYEAERGPIAPGLEIDHLCRNKACVNPDHLEAVTRLQNARRRFRLTAEEHREARGLVM